MEVISKMNVFKFGVEVSLRGSYSVEFIVEDFVLKKGQNIFREFLHSYFPIHVLNYSSSIMVIIIAK